MAAHLITGYKGSEHIQSADARSFNMAMFGGGEFVMEIGEQLDASITNNNTVRILDGDILMQGGHIRIETGTYEDMTIETGTAGKSRIDLIVMTYEKNALDGTEKAYLEVIKGTPTEETPTDPAYEQGTLAEGDLKNQMPLYRVKVEGVVLTSLEVLFKTIPTYKTIAEQYAAQFQKACDTYLGALNVLDTMEEVNANTQTNQLAGALAVKEGIASLNLKMDGKQRNLSQGIFTGSIDKVNADGSNGSLKENSIVWVHSAQASGGHPPAEYYLLETLMAGTGIIVQRATQYIYQGAPVVYERMYVNEQWSNAWAKLN